MATMNDEHLVAALAEALEASVGGFDAHRRKDQGARQRGDQALTRAIVPVFAASRQTFDCRCVITALRRDGVRCG